MDDNKDGEFPVSDEMKAMEEGGNVIDMLTQRKLPGAGKTFEPDGMLMPEGESPYLKGRRHKGEDGKAIVQAYKNAHGKPRAGPILPDGLTHKQDRFCRLVAYGDSLSAAYAQAFNPPKSSRRTIEGAASRLYRLPQIKARVDLFKQRLNDQEERVAVRSVERWFDAVWQLADEADTDATRVSALKLIGNALGVGKQSDEKQGQEKPEDIEQELKHKLSAALARLTHE